MNPEQIVALGSFCEDLMRHDAFNALCDIYRHQAFQALMSTQPHETKTREAIYSQVHSLQTFLALMANFVSQKEALLAGDDDQEQDTE